jgi:multidrug transporter EmrE-like cation transporter
MVSIIIVVVCGAYAQYLAKMYNKTKNLWYLIGSGTSFTIGVLSLFTAYMHHNEYIWLLNALWSLISIIALYIVGYVFFDEKISMNEIIACIFIMISVYLMYPWYTVT